MNTIFNVVIIVTGVHWIGSDCQHSFKFYYHHELIFFPNRTVVPVEDGCQRVSQVSKVIHEWAAVRMKRLPPFLLHYYNSVCEFVLTSGLDEMSLLPANIFARPVRSFTAQCVNQGWNCLPTCYHLAYGWANDANSVPEVPLWPSLGSSFDIDRRQIKKLLPRFVLGSSCGLYTAWFCPRAEMTHSVLFWRVVCHVPSDLLLWPVFFTSWSVANTPPATYDTWEILSLSVALSILTI